MAPRRNRNAQSLSDFPLFRGFSPEELREIETKLEVQRTAYQEKDIAAWEDTPVSGVALVTQGVLVASRFGNEKSPQTMNMFYPGDTLGLAEYLTTPKTWARTFVCAKPSELLWLDLDRLMDSADTPEDLGLKLRLLHNAASMAADDSIKQLYRIEVLSTNPLRERILLFLRMQREKHGGEWVELRMNRGQFADYLCVDQATLSRELRKMEDMGLLQLRGDRAYKLLSELTRE